MNATKKTNALDVIGALVRDARAMQSVATKTGNRELAREASQNVTSLVNVHAAVAGALRDLRQIAVLAEYGTTGPNSKPPCKSFPMTADEATAMRGAISELSRGAIANMGAAP